MEQEKKWYKAVNELKPYIFKISTPSGHGTGFQIFYPNNTSLCGVATAHHVVEHEEEWGEPIKILHHASGKSVVLHDKDRVIFVYPSYDLAFILFNKELLPLEKKDLKLIEPERILKQGVELGWCGFPHIAQSGELCFFQGYISGCSRNEDYYFVDGVAINGVSGGPAFYFDTKTGDVKICGVISAYKPNRVYGEVHPGLSKVCLVEPYQEMLKDFKSKEEAAQKAKEEKENQGKSEESKTVEEIVKPEEPKIVKTKK